MVIIRETIRAIKEPKLLLNLNNKIYKEIKCEFFDDL